MDAQVRDWLVVGLVVLLVVCLLAFARGREHRRGDDVGAFAPPPTVIVR
jgi:hypothetical protein